MGLASVMCCLNLLLSIERLSEVSELADIFYGFFSRLSNKCMSFFIFEMQQYHVEFLLKDESNLSFRIRAKLMMSRTIASAVCCTISSRLLSVRSSLLTTVGEL